MKPRPLQPRLPAAPLVAVVEQRGGPTALGWLNKSATRRAFARAKTAGELTYWAADRLANELGYHPSELWPAWFDLEWDIECGPRDA